MSRSINQPSSPAGPLGTGGVFISAVALVVSASTLVTNFTGFALLGAGFDVSLLRTPFALGPVFALADWLVRQAAAIAR